MLLNEIVPCDPPLMQGPKPLPIDEQILEALSDGPKQLSEVAKATGETPHRVHARLTTMMKRGQVERTPLSDRTHGPGISQYSLVRPDDE